MAISKTKFIWLNGNVVKWDDAKIHVLTHGLHYGSGVFEGIRCYDTPKGPAVFRLKDHMKRLENGCRTYGMKLPYYADQLCEATKKLVKENGLKECYIRPIAYFGYGSMGLKPLGVPVDVAIAMWPWGAYLGEEGLEKGIRARVSSWRRIDSAALPMGAKATGQYIGSILAAMEARACGVDEAIVLNSQGLVAEGPGENLFLVKNGEISTPSTDAGILSGITRDSIIKIAKKQGLEVRERVIARDELYTADELFFTGTAAEVTPVREVDGIQIGIGKRGPVTEKVQKAFFDAVHGKSRDFKDWLDFA